MNKKFISVINDYTFDNKYSEDKIMEVCGYTNQVLHLMHPSATIRIYYERARRAMKMEMEHESNFVYERATQYKNAMKLFDCAIECITQGIECDVVNGAILSPRSNCFIKGRGKGIYE